jgi:hypothetical protein
MNSKDPARRVRRWREFSAAFWLVICSSPSCARPSAPPTSPNQPSTPRVAPSPQALPRLEESVEQLGDQAQVDQHALAKVLKNLARAMQPISAAANLRLTELAQRLDASPPDLLTHAGLLKQSLDVALQGLLAAHVPNETRPAHERGLRALSAAKDAVADVTPLSVQKAPILAALQAATDAVFVARGEPAPFGEAERPQITAAPVGSLEDEIQQASDDVAKLAQADETRPHTALAHALSSLADVIAAADQNAALKPRVDELRFQAERLERGDPLNFGRAGWIQVALTSALDAWEALGYSAEKRAQIWLRNARRAVANLDPRSALSFQRAAIQEAFRATVDAFAAARDIGASSH